MAYDEARARTVLFGGYDISVSSDTWEWDGSVWTLRTNLDAVPPERMRHAMAYDPVRARIVLYGGRQTYAYGSALGDTWEWDGLHWANVGVNGPSRSDHAMAYDPAYGNVLMAGGNDGVYDVADAWLWSGSNWTPATGFTSTSGKSALAYDAWLQEMVVAVGVAMVYDSARERVVRFDGSDGSTWEYTGCKSDADCVDDDLCNGAEKCNGSTCVGGTPCPSFACGAYPINGAPPMCNPTTGECATHSCDDYNPCTKDECLGNYSDYRCYNTPVAGCVSSNDAGVDAAYVPDAADDAPRRPESIPDTTPDTTPDAGTAPRSSTTGSDCSCRTAPGRPNTAPPLFLLFAISAIASRARRKNLSVPRPHQREGQLPGPKGRHDR
jgi:hypothetical protein